VTETGISSGSYEPVGSKASLLWCKIHVDIQKIGGKCVVELEECIYKNEMFIHLHDYDLIL